MSAPHAASIAPIASVEAEHPWLWLLYAAAFVAAVALSAFFA